jgi:hypothetical protein
MRIIPPIGGDPIGVRRRKAPKGSSDAHQVAISGKPRKSS